MENIKKLTDSKPLREWLGDCSPDHTFRGLLNGGNIYVLGSTHYWIGTEFDELDKSDDDYAWMVDRLDEPAYIGFYDDGVDDEVFLIIEGDEDLLVDL